MALHPRDDVDRQEDDLPALKIALTHEYNELKTT